MTVFNDLMSLLSLALNRSEHTEEEIKEILDKLDLDEEGWQKLMTLSVENSVTGLWFDILYEYDKLPIKAKNALKHYAQKICKRNYRYLVLAIRIKQAFEEAHIPFCILKGMAAGADYPVPDVRKVSDLDIFVASPNDIKKAVKLAEELGFRADEEQHSLRHVEMRDEAGNKLELHGMLAEPFDNAKTNAFLEKLLPDCSKHIVEKEILGTTLPVLDDAYHAYELLMHMLQHFLNSGFGVRLLCDWVVLWNRGLSKKDEELFLKLVEESKVKGFLDTITRVCVKYLGLKREKVLSMNLYDKNRSRQELEDEAEDFLKEMMDAGEFGKNKERMVALRGSGIFDYMREFHHQMHLNFPKAGKCFLLWPVLWVMTLVKFLRNNKKVRSVSTREVFESAKKRSRLVKNMHLFN